MSAEDNSAQPSEDPALTARIGYVERDAAVEILRTAAGAGRITLAALEERMELVVAARFPIDLDQALEGVVTELPSARAVSRSGKWRGSYRAKWPIALSHVRLGIPRRVPGDYAIKQPI